MCLHMQMEWESQHRELDSFIVCLESTISQLKVGFVIRFCDYVLNA
jgi:hypothetical protein